MFSTEDKQYLKLFIRYILISVVIFAGLTIIHSWITYHKIQLVNFIVPLFAGLAVGLLMARNKILRIQLTHLANTDKLTGAYNRLYFDRRLNEEATLARRHKHGFSIIYIDLDHFKQVNDQFGHSVGDQVLINFSAIVKKINRETDLFARFGGEEFIILLVMADIAAAHALDKRIREAIQKHPLHDAKEVTYSAGITEFKPDTDSIRSVLERADQALYKAKNQGRNQAVVSD